MILITGHKGFIGSRLMWNLGRVAKGIDMKDGLNLLTCELPEGVDLIYHLAAQSSVESSWHDPLHDLDNIRITARLAHTYPNAKIIYTNSCAAIDPKSPYAFSKRASHDYLHKFHKNTVSLVLPNIFGEGSKSVVDIFKRQQNVVIYGDGSHTRSYVHVDDIVDALVKAHAWDAGTYLCGNDVGVSVMQLAEGKNVKFMPERKETSHVVVPNTTPDWEPKINVKDYLLI